MNFSHEFMNVKPPEFNITTSKNKS